MHSNEPSVTLELEHFLSSSGGNKDMVGEIQLHIKRSEFVRLHILVYIYMNEVKESRSLRTDPKVPPVRYLVHMRSSEEM